MKTLRLTSFNTIVGDDFDEMFVDKFFEIMDTRLGEDYAGYYEEDNNRFKVVFNGVKYYLTLDKVTMDNYAFGNYNNFTSKLKRLIDRVQGIEQENADEKERNLNKKQIIKDAEKGLIPNDEARRVYLEYLKDNKKFSFSKIGTYFSNLISDLKTSCYYVNDWMWNTEIWPFKNMWEGMEYFGYTIIGSLIIGAIIAFYLTGLEILKGINPYDAKYLKWMLLSFLPQATYLVPITKFLGFQVKQRFSRLINYGKNKRLTNHKIEQLTEELKIGRIQSSYDSFDKTLPEPIHKEQDKPVPDPVLQNLRDIVKRLNYLNAEDKKSLLAEVDAIADEYIERLQKIREQDLEEGLQIHNDNQFALQSEMFEKIVWIEQKMEQIRTSDLEANSIEAQRLILANEIEACYNAEDKVIGGERSPRTRKPSDRNK